MRAIAPALLFQHSHLIWKKLKSKRKPWGSRTAGVSGSMLNPVLRLCLQWKNVLTTALCPVRKAGKRRSHKGKQCQPSSWTLSIPASVNFCHREVMLPANDIPTWEPHCWVMSLMPAQTVQLIPALLNIQYLSWNQLSWWEKHNITAFAKKSCNLNFYGWIRTENLV
jgi:hypothetical protein